MKRLLTWQKVVGVLSVVILGGFASTISDILFKPVVLAISDAMLDVATLGITSVRDGMYVEVAKGSYERAAVNLLLAWTSLVFVITFFTTAIALVVTKPGFRAHLREAIESGKQIEEPTLARARGLISILVVVNCLTAGFIMASGIRMIYVVRAANYLEQLERVVSPYITMDQRLMIQSRVAQIGSKNDYEAVVAEMTKIAETNKLRIPTFDIN